MRVYVEPALNQWRPASLAPNHRPAVVAMSHAHASRLGTGVIPMSQPLIATGHQAWLWHPGILAKDMAAQAFACRHQAGWFHLVVDTDVHEALNLPLAVREGMRLRLEKLVLGRQHKLVPIGAHPPAEVAHMRQAVHQARSQWGDQLAVDLSKLQQAIEKLAQLDCRTLAEQMTVVQQHLIQPSVDPWPIVFASQLSGWACFGEWVNRMMADPHTCVRAYNQAVHEQPHSGMAVLRCDESRVELPLWLMSWDKPRLRVFADRSDSGFVLLDEQRRTVDVASALSAVATSRLVPRALLLTALLRSAGCDLFVHGKGGEHYDPVMERWWELWQPQPLAPMATVSADLHLSFDVPVNDRAAWQRAIWWAHHLPHNLDRVLHLQDEMAQEKQRLLGQLSTLSDRTKKAQAFARLHQLNGEWTQSFAPLVEQSREQVERHHAGLANLALAQKRDWPVAWYPQESLQTMHRYFQES